ncbi:MAG: hypothetical protein VXZ72_02125, partial [Chlamydiota bacterium]|nr:hypothetical protein [Chlamydiota bacterium]
MNVSYYSNCADLLALENSNDKEERLEKEKQGFEKKLKENEGVYLFHKVSLAATAILFFSTAVFISGGGSTPIKSFFLNAKTLPIYVNSILAIGIIAAAIFLNLGQPICGDIPLNMSNVRMKNAYIVFSLFCLFLSIGLIVYQALKGKPISSFLQGASTIQSLSPTHKVILTLSTIGITILPWTFKSNKENLQNFKKYQTSLDKEEQKLDVAAAETANF